MRFKGMDNRQLLLADVADAGERPRGACIPGSEGMEFKCDCGVVWEHAK